MTPTKDLSDETTSKLNLNFQKIFRCLDFGRSLQGKAPSLTVTQMRVLSFFNEQDVIYISEISHALRMSIQSVTNLVSRLETIGYIGRSKNSQDKRFSGIRLTAKGRKGFDAFRNEQLETLANILNNLEPTERKNLSATIENAALVMEKAVLKASHGEEATGKQPIRSISKSE